jgi:N utilization substance protein A
LEKDKQIETLKKEKEEIIKKLKDLGVEEDLMNLKGLTPGMVVTLGEQNIKKLKDFVRLELQPCLVLNLLNSLNLLLLPNL